MQQKLTEAEEFKFTGLAYGRGSPMLLPLQKTDKEAAELCVRRMANAAL